MVPGRRCPMQKLHFLIGTVRVSTTANGHPYRLVANGALDLSDQINRKWRQLRTRSNPITVSRKKFVGPANEVFERDIPFGLYRFDCFLGFPVMGELPGHIAVQCVSHS